MCIFFYHKVSQIWTRGWDCPKLGQYWSNSGETNGQSNAFDRGHCWLCVEPNYDMSWWNVHKWLKEFQCILSSTSKYQLSGQKLVILLHCQNKIFSSKRELPFLRPSSFIIYAFYRENKSASNHVVENLSIWYSNAWNGSYWINHLMHKFENETLEKITLSVDDTM